MADDSYGNEDCDRLRHHLEARRRQVVDDLQRCLSRIREAEGRTADTEVVEEDTSDIDVGLVDILSAMVRRIDAALDRLADGGYGRCTRCHRPISPARLQALPFAVRCHACEASREHDAAVRRARSRPSPFDDVRLAQRASEES